VSDNLTPTAQAILDHLHDQPPTTAADLRDRTGRSRSAIDKALAELAKTGLAVKTTPDTGEGPTLWTLTGTDPTDHPAETAEPSDPPGPAEVGGDEPGQDDLPIPDGTDSADRPTGPDDDDAAGDGLPPDASAGEQADPALEVKVCRGCGEQMPTTCPTCQQKTTAYCGSCRKTHPATRRRAPGEPQILANGLPKLLPGQLERLVADVIATQPLPDHLGITGWTSGRVAIFLPGRSTGAIGNALDKLAATGHARLLGDNPKRYQPTPTDDPPTDRSRKPPAGPGGPPPDTGRPTPGRVGGGNLTRRPPQIRT
jgi:hypothetical protein